MCGHDDDNLLKNFSSRYYTRRSRTIYSQLECTVSCRYNTISTFTHIFGL